MIKALGLDLGRKTIGIAISDFLGFVHGVETFRFKLDEFDEAAKHVIALAKEKDINDIALGYPLRLNGEKSNMTDNVLMFKDLLLNKNPNLKIELVDERYSTIEASKTLHDCGVNAKKQKEMIDTVAACQILDTYIRRVG